MANPAAFPMKALRAGVRYVTRNPASLISAARHSLGMRVLVPIDALRWLVSQKPPGKKGPKDVVLGANPPSLSLGATTDLMGNEIRAEADIRIEELRFSPEELRVVLRLSNVRLNALNPNSPAAMLFKSLDLSKPANLANFLPKKPAALVEAKDDMLVLDLARDPKIGESALVQRLVKLITPLVAIRDIRTEGDNLIISWRPTPRGLPAVLAALRP